VVTITFDTILAPLAFSTPVTFGDTPIVRDVISTNADPLFATYADGAVTFATGLESDVTPRFSGDNILTVTDYTQTGLFAVGLDTPNPSFNEFQRADSAPIETRGDGFITVADYVQAGRYAVSLDDGSPVVNQISDAAARALPATFVSGTIDISGTASNGFSVSGTVVSSSGMPISNVTIVLTDRTGIARSAISNPFGFFEIKNIPTGVVYTLSATSKRYSFPTSTVVMNADLVGIDLVADP